MYVATQPRVALPNFKEAEQVAENGTVSKEHSMAQRQMVRVSAVTSQSSWTPEAIAGIVFGVLMFLLGVIAVLQTRNQKLIVIGDIESDLRLPVMPCTHVIKTDPNLWVPPYEPPQDFVCIADPPDNYANTGGWVWGGQEPKKPAPKPKPMPKPPQPRDGYEIGLDWTDATPDIKNYPAWSLGGQDSKKPAPTPKPKPSPKPMPPQPRDGYGVEIDLSDATPDIKDHHAWSLGGQGPPKPAPKPSPKPIPPQPRDRYVASSTPIFLTTQHQKPFPKKPQYLEKAWAMYRWLVDRTTCKRSIIQGGSSGFSF